MSQHTPPKALLFDFDGVVVNTESIYEAYTRERFLQYGIQLPPSEWSLFKGISCDLFFQLIKSRYLPEVNIDDLEQEWQIGLREKIRKDIRYTPGFCDLFDQISSHFKTALVTSSRREMVQWIIDNTEIGNHFSLMITADDVKRTKPDAEPYLTASEKLNVDIRHCIVIEDSLRGVSSGKESGAFVIAITTTHAREELQAADLVIDAWEELTPEVLWALKQTDNK